MAGAVAGRYLSLGRRLPAAGATRVLQRESLRPSLVCFISVACPQPTPACFYAKPMPRP